MNGCRLLGLRTDSPCGIVVIDGVRKVSIACCMVLSSCNSIMLILSSLGAMLVSSSCVIDIESSCRCVGVRVMTFAVFGGLFDRLSRRRNRFELNRGKRGASFLNGQSARQ